MRAADPIECCIQIIPFPSFKHPHSNDLCIRRNTAWRYRTATGDDAGDMRSVPSRVRRRAGSELMVAIIWTTKSCSAEAGFGYDVVAQIAVHRVDAAVEHRYRSS